MQYTTLTDADLDEITRQRIRALEADHYLHELRLVECVDLTEAASVKAKLDDLARRIRVHFVDVDPEPAEPEPEGTDASGPPPDDRVGAVNGSGPLAGSPAV